MNDQFPIRPEQPGNDEPIRAEVVNYYPGPTHAHQGVGTDSGAVIALSLSILSWVMLPVVAAIAALVIAPGAKRRIRAANGALGNTSIVTAAQVLALLNLFAVALLGLLFVVLIRAIF